MIRRAVCCALALCVAAVPARGLAGPSGEPSAEGADAAPATIAEDAAADEAEALPPEPDGDLGVEVEGQTEPAPLVEAEIEAAPPPDGAPANDSLAPDSGTNPEDGSPDAYGPDQGFAPGGYYRPGEILEREPPDGRRNIVIGSIFAPLGLIATVTSAAGVYLTVPSHCVERLPSIGVEIDDPERCRGVYAFNLVRTTYGALMLVSGSVILGIGLVQRHKYRRWRQEHGLRAWIAPQWPAPGRRAGRAGATVGLRLRF